MFHLYTAAETQQEAAYAYAEAMYHFQRRHWKRATQWQRFAAEIYQKAWTHMVLANENGE